MNEQRLRELLESTHVPEEVEALRRNWRLVAAAYEQEEAELRRERYVRPLVVLAAAAALVAGALSPPGQALGGWVRETVRERLAGETAARPALVSLPARGRVLAVSPGGAWIVHEDGSKRRLGAYEDAAWSPHGRFVAVTRGRELVAVDPRGEVRWSLARARPVAAPRWSPSGFRIAYLAGRSLRVVAGDGSGDRRLAGRVAPAAAWRPGEHHVLAFAGPAGRVRVVDVDAGRELWRTRSPARVVHLEWSTDGARLLVATARRVRLYGADARAGRDVAVPAGARTTAAAFRAGTRDVAYAAAAGESAFVFLLRPGSEPRLVFRGAGRFPDLASSPDGRWLLVAWREADQWLFIRAPGVRRIVAASSISRQLDPGRAEPSAFPRLRGWCCVR